MTKKTDPSLKCSFDWRKPIFALLGFVLLFSALAIAEGPTPDAPEAAQPAPTVVQAIQKVLGQDHMLGNWGGLRSKLAEEKGISFFIFNHTDFMNDPAGGNYNGFGVWNRVRGIITVDMEKLARVKGLSITALPVWNNGTDVGYQYLGTVMVLTGNDAIRHQFRLDQWYVTQDLFKKKLSISAGQIDPVTYFGWMPSGFNHFMMEPLFYAPLAPFNALDKPDVPWSSPAAMVQITPNKHFYYRTMVSSNSLQEGTSAGNGLEPIFKGGVTWLNNFAFLYGQPTTKDVKDYSGEAHFGITYTGASLKNFGVVEPGTTSNGTSGYWANVIQPVYRVKAGSNRGVDLRVMYSWGPENKGLLPFDRQLDISAIIQGPIRSRPQDSINLGMNMYMIRNYLNTPQNLAVGLPVTSEKDWELNYSWWATKWFNVMPVVVVVQDINANPRKGNGVVAGVRTFVNF